MSLSDDPFDCFGDDDYDDDDSEDEFQVPEITQNDQDHAATSMNARRQLLVEQANARIDNRTTEDASTSTSTSTSASDNLTSASASASASTSTPEELVELQPTVNLPFPPPLYMGPMKVVTSNDIGGNRGYIATQDLQPGTLLLVEQPIFTWPDEQIGSELGLVSIQGIFTHENADKIIDDLQGLYPTKEQIDDIIRENGGGGGGGGGEKSKDATLLSQDEKIQIKDMMEIMEMQHSGADMDATVELAKHCGIQIDEIDVYRMLLAMRYNGFGSGIYLHFAMFNHEFDANCIKFIPEKNDHDAQSQSQRCCYSEVRTTQFVRRGDPLTLDYLDPREQSHATKRRHLWDQHRFDIGDLQSIPLPHLREMDLVGDQYPPSAPDNLDHDSDTYHVESALKELEEQHNEIKLTWNLISRLNEGGDDAIELFERSKAMEMAAFEMITLVQDKLRNPVHILLIRCCRLYLDVAEVLLRMGAQLSPGLTPNQESRVMANFVCASHVLLPLQVKYLGKHHVDVARTNHDLGTSINLMISRCPEWLWGKQGTQLDEFSTFAKCQRMEAMYMKEFRRIDAMYPKDAEEKLQGKGDRQ